MKYLSFLLILVSCSHPVKKEKPKVALSHFPRVVYNSCADEYAVKTDTFSYFGVVPKITIGQYSAVMEISSGIMTVWGTMSSDNSEPPPPPPPSLIVISSLHDTLKCTVLGGEFQFKDSVEAMKSYLSFSKECKDTENIRNAPILVKIKHYWDSAHAKAYNDSIANRGRIVRDSIFKCQHTYQ